MSKIGPNTEPWGTPLLFLCTDRILSKCLLIIFECLKKRYKNVIYYYYFPNNLQTSKLLVWELQLCLTRLSFPVAPGSEAKKQPKKKPRKHGGLSGTSSEESESEESDRESGKDSDDSFKSISSGDEDDDFNPFRDESDEDEEDGEFRKSLRTSVRWSSLALAYIFCQPIRFIYLWLFFFFSICRETGLKFLS